VFDCRISPWLQKVLDRHHANEAAGLADNRKRTTPDSHRLHDAAELRVTVRSDIVTILAPEMMMSG
jgi:hypothetical protein